MMMTWWFLWSAFIVLFLFPPISYGWGYRGWGMPYPSFVQRRRGQAAALNGSPDLDHQAWGWGGDFVWMVLVVGICWAFAGMWWR